MGNVPYQSPIYYGHPTIMPPKQLHQGTQLRRSRECCLGPGRSNTVMVTAARTRKEAQHAERFDEQKEERQKEEQSRGLPDFEQIAIDCNSFSQEALDQIDKYVSFTNAKLRWAYCTQRGRELTQEEVNLTLKDLQLQSMPRYGNEQVSIIGAYQKKRNEKNKDVHTHEVKIIFFKRRDRHDRGHSSMVDEMDICTRAPKDTFDILAVEVSLTDVNDESFNVRTTAEDKGGVMSTFAKLIQRPFSIFEEQGNIERLVQVQVLMGFTMLRLIDEGILVFDPRCKSPTFVYDGQHYYIPSPSLSLSITEYKVPDGGNSVDLDNESNEDDDSDTDMDAANVDLRVDIDMDLDGDGGINKNREGEEDGEVEAETDRDKDNRQLSLVVLKMIEDSSNNTDEYGNDPSEHDYDSDSCWSSWDTDNDSTTDFREW